MQTRSRRETDAPSPVDRVRIERVLATTRLLLSFVAFALVRFEGAGGTGSLASLTAGYAWLSLLVFLLSRVAPSWLRAAGYPLHILDVTSVVIFAALTHGSNGPLLILFVFVLYGGGARWGLPGVMTTGILVIALPLTGMAVAPTLAGLNVMTTKDVVMRTCYLLALTLMLGLLAQHERASGREREAISRVIVGIGRAPSLTAGLRLLFEQCQAHFGPSAALVALEASRTGQFYLWHQATPTGADTTLVAEELAPARGQAYLAPAPRNVSAWHLWRTGGAALVGRGIVSTTGFLRRIDGAFAARLVERYDATSLLGADSHGNGEWRARFVLLDPSRHSSDDLRFLLLLASQAAPALHHQYLAHRLRSRVSAMERARLARELHDGPIQSLIALEMEVEVLRRQASRSGIPEGRLVQLRDRLRCATGDIRDLVLQLRPEVETGRDVLRLIAELAGRLRRDVGLDVQLLSTIHDLDCRPRTCRELARLVQEALTNVRKHSGARRVVISLSQGELTNQLVIEDDGRGFGFEGRWSLEQLEASERGPAVIKERVRAMGGNLVIDSHPGRARLEVEWLRSPQ